MTTVAKNSRVQPILNSVADFDEFGTRTEVRETSVGTDAAGLNYFINQFWTSAQRAGHSLHEVSYRACFKPQLPQFFIERLTDPGQVVYDPFMGRGTTPIQAGLMGRVPIGNDANPLSAIITKPRLTTPDLVEVENRLYEINWDQHRPASTDDELLVFYHPETLSQIQSLRRWFRDRLADGTFDPVDDWIRMVAVSRLTGHSPGFFSVYTMPPNQAVRVERQRRINERRNQSPEPKDVPDLTLKKSASLLRDGALNCTPHLLLCEQAQHTPEVESNSVDLVVTSPPFLDVVDYRSDNHVRAWFTEADSNEHQFSNFRSIRDWRDFTAEVLTELCRVVKPGGFIAYEVGEVHSGKVLLESVVVEAVSQCNLPVKVHGVLVNSQRFTKTANTWGIQNNVMGTNTNRVVLMEVLS